MTSKLVAEFNELEPNEAPDDSKDEVDGSVEIGFGIIILTIGIIAFFNNTTIIVAIARHLRFRHVLYMIITNFAVIDLLKAICAIYIGSIMIFMYSMNGSAGPSSSSYFIAMKLLQASVFVVNLGNVASVLNLVLASVNEFLYMKLPFSYGRIVCRRNAAVAILACWCASITFCLAKVFGGYRSRRGGGREIWIPMNESETKRNSADRSSGNVPTLEQILEQMKRIAAEELRLRSADHISTASSGHEEPLDKYSIILMTCLVICLMIVMGAYTSLYVLIRRSGNFAKAKMKEEPQKSMPILKDPLHNYLEAPYTPAIMISSDEQDQNQTSVSPAAISAGVSVKELQEPRRKESDISQSSVSFGENSRPVDCYNQPSLISDTAVTSSGSSKTAKRMQRRYKAVLVIMTIAGIYTTYVAVYITLQLLHYYNVKESICQACLTERYVINFVLRVIYFVQAATNPLLFLRIRSFRASFVKVSKTLFCFVDYNSFGSSKSSNLKTSSANSSFRHRISTSCAGTAGDVINARLLHASPKTSLAAAASNERKLSGLSLTVHPDEATNVFLAGDSNSRRISRRSIQSAVDD